MKQNERREETTYKVEYGDPTNLTERTVTGGEVSMTTTDPSGTKRLTVWEAAEDGEEVFDLFVSSRDMMSYEVVE